MINGTAAHGEDYDDTLEGTPNHVGAVVIPAVLSITESRQQSGQDMTGAVAAGMELMARMVRVVPGGFHKACFHPTAITGTFGATMGASHALGLTTSQTGSALGIAGSLCSGIIEYLTEGTWTKRLHAGWAAHSGIHAARLASTDFHGPRTVFGGDHNVFRAFASSVEPDLSVLTTGLGESWAIRHIAFKPYACGTMIHPYIDCAIRLAESGVDASNIESITCKTAEAIVHRLWEPLSEKQTPRNGYAGKFSIPYSMAVAFFDGAAGFEQYTDERVTDEAVLNFASKVTYVVDPQDPYPNEYTGDAEVVLTNGETVHISQPHFRGGMHEPLSDGDINDKFISNLRYGGVSETVATDALSRLRAIPTSAEPVDLSWLRSL